MITLKEIDGRISAFKVSQQTLLDEVQSIAIAILEHAEKHGDCSRSQHLVNAMHKSMKKTALVDWFTAFSPIVVKTGPAGHEWNAKMHKADTKLYVPFDIEAAKDTPWYEFAKDDVAAQYDFDKLLKMVAALAKTIDKKIEDGRVKPEDVDSARGISTILTGLKIARVTIKPTISTDNVVTGANDKGEGEEGEAPLTKESAAA